MSGLVDVVAADRAYALATAVFYADQGAHAGRGGMYIALSRLLYAVLDGGDQDAARLALAGSFTATDTREVLFYRDKYLEDPQPLRRALGHELAQAWDRYESAALAEMLGAS